jgi:hypothetical protein
VIGDQAEQAEGLIIDGRKLKAASGAGEPYPDQECAPGRGSLWEDASEGSDCLLLQGQREILEPIPDFGDMTDAGPREVIRQQRRPVCREHGQHPHAALRRRHRVGVKRELRARMLEQQHRMMRQVADVAKLLTARVDHEYRVANRMTRSGKHRDAGKDFLVVFVVLHRALPDLQRMKLLLFRCRVVGSEVGILFGAIKPDL